MNTPRYSSILILLLLVGVPLAEAEDDPDAREAERRALLEAMKKATPMTPIEPTKQFTPEETASADQRTVVHVDLTTGTMTVTPASEQVPAGIGMREPFAGLLEDAGGILGLEAESDQEGTLAMPLISVPDATEAPYRSVVKLLVRFEQNGVSRWGACSGSLIDEFHVLTAAHCIHTWDFNGDKTYNDPEGAAEMWIFPAQGDAVDPFNDATDFDLEEDWPFGIARAVGYRVYSGWVDSRNFNHDWGLITLNRRSGLHTGWMGMEYGVTTDVLNFSGYPREAAYGYGDEVVQWTAWGPVIFYAGYRVTLDALSYGGHSGGPTWRYHSGNQWIEAVHSTSNRAGIRTDTLLTASKHTDLQSWVAEDRLVRPPVAMADLQECFFSSWGCYKDLQIGSVQQGGTTRVVYNAVNTGHAYSGDVTFDFYLSTDDVITTADTLVLSGTLHGLYPLEAYNRPADLVVPYDLPPGDYYVGWILRAGAPEYDVFPYDNNVVVIADERLSVAEAHFVTVTSPNGGELWYEGNTRTITWSSLGAGDFVSIELSRNGGASYEVLEFATENDGVYDWPVTGPISDDCLVRITPTNYPGAGDVSDASFSIRPALLQMYVTSPNGGETWFTGHPFDITWNSYLAGPTVRIELSRTSGATWETIAASTPNDGLFTWTVSGSTSNGCLIKVTSISAPGATDASDGYFSISTLASTLALQDPNGGELLAIGRPYDIRWTSALLIGEIKIELSRNWGLAWETIVDATPNDGLFTWEVTGPTTTAARIRVSSVNTPFLADTSETNFSIVYSLSSIQVASPTDGEIAYQGYPLGISWNSTYVTGDVMIELSRNWGISWETIAASTPNDGQFTWSVTGATSDSCVVRVSSVADPLVHDVSDGFFSIATLLSNLFLTSPNGGEVLNSGQPFDITWNSSFLIGEIGIDMSRDGGDTWETIVPSTANDGLFGWVVTGAMSDDCLMRVRSIGLPILYDTSNGSFSVSSLTPSLQIDEPDGGEEWHMDVAYVLRWSSALVTSDVAFDVSRDGGVTWETIIGSTANDGLQIWYPTGPESTESRIRIRSVGDPGVEDTSDGDFTIAPLYDARLTGMRRMGGGQIELQWTDTDWEELYGIYRGTLTAPFGYDHDTILACDLAGGTTQWMTPDDQETGQPSYYYLVVPQFQNTHQFGTDSGGDYRPPAATTCP